ncbi:MAG: hypothetical protein GC172_12560 [Phycisphaera sp.]|nr:hypothetical protein [Phycisphaera sp.]
MSAPLPPRARTVRALSPWCAAALLFCSCAAPRPTLPAAPAEAEPSERATQSAAEPVPTRGDARPAPSTAPEAPREAADAAPRDARPPAPRSVASEWTALTPLVRVDRATRTVEFDAVAVLDVGFLEQLVCMVGTREHESIFAFEGKPSEIHAALLLVGALPGRPGHWREVTSADGSSAIEGVPPQGTDVAIEVELPDGAVRGIEWFVRASPISTASGAAPPSTFVFAGSRFVRNPRTHEERYAADGSGSLIGLVTFGDETIGAVEVIPDSAQAAAPVWEVFTERAPTPGTRVKVRVRARPPSGDSIAPR